MDNLEEIDECVEMHNALRLNQEKIEKTNRPITSTEIETVIKTLPTGERRWRKSKMRRSPSFPQIQ